MKTEDWERDLTGKLAVFVDTWKGFQGTEQGGAQSFMGSLLEIYGASFRPGTVFEQHPIKVLAATLTYAAGANGTLAGTTPQTVNYGTGGTAVAAMPLTGNHFVNWSDGGTANPRTDANVTANLSVTANFTRIRHVLTVTAVPAEGGGVTGGGTYDQGSIQPISATPAAGWQFVNWTGSGIADPSSASTTVAFEAAKTVTANFERMNPDANGNGILDEWEKSHFGNADPGANPAAGDTDYDGISNLLEYAFDSDPLLPNASPLKPDFEEVAGARYLRLTVPKNPVATNLIYTVEACADLTDNTWSGDGLVVEADTPDHLVVRDPLAVASSPRRFVRLKVAVRP